MTFTAASVAQTNLQLYGQLRRAGWPTAEIEAVGTGYRLAAELLSGQYRASGKVADDHFCAKHDLGRGHITDRINFSNNLRRMIFTRSRRPLRRVLVPLHLGRMESAIAHVVFRIERLLNRLLIRPGPTSF